MCTMMTTGTAPTEIYYEDVGRGQSVVLIHGWPLSLRMWERQVNALTAAGYRCIAYDRRGFGDSGKPTGGFDYDTLAADLNDLLTHLDLRDAVLVGFSMGGGEVARYLGNFGSARVAKAVLLGSITPFLLESTLAADGMTHERVFETMRDEVRNDRIGFLERFFVDFYSTADGVQTIGADLIQHSMSLALAASPLAAQECILAFGTTDFRGDLSGIDIPTLIVHGDSDRIVPPAASATLSHRLIKDSRLAVLRGAPHGFTATHANELNSLLLEFLGSGPTRRAVDRHAGVLHKSPRRAMPAAGLARHHPHEGPPVADRAISVQTGGFVQKAMKGAKSGMLMLALLLGSFAVACGDGTGPNADPSPTVPGVGPGTGVPGGRGPSPVPLGAASDFVILAKTGISTVPTSAITGNIGVSPAAATFITGFSLTLGAGAAFATSTQVTGSVFAPEYAAPTPANLTAAVSAMETAYTNAAGRTLPDHIELASGNIGGLTLPAGLYKWSSAVTVPTNVTLTGSATDVWIFQVAGGLTVSSGKRVMLTGGALASNIFWQVAGVVTVGTTAHLEGQVLSQTSIILRTGSSANGRLLAQTAVTLSSSTVVVQ